MNASLCKVKVAIVHDWLVSYRGGEKVLQSLLDLFPNAPIYTLFYDRNQLPDSFHNREIIYPKWLNKFRLVRKLFLPFYPAIIESFDLSSYDVIISTSSCVAKGVIPRPGAHHVCYVHSPMRYVWDQRFSYLPTIRSIPGLAFAFECMSNYLRLWDVMSTNRVDTLISNSSFVQSRIRQYYRRESQVIHPPVAVDRFKIRQLGRPRDYLLAAGAMVPYKRFDLAIQACERAEVRLIVAGDGPEFKNLKRHAGRYTEFVNAPSDDRLTELMQGAKALLFPGVEDFGIIGIEAMASGTPIIAFDQGGAKDFVVHEKTGLFFSDQSVSALVDAIERLNAVTFNEQAVSNHAMTFSAERFKSEFWQAVQLAAGASS